MKQAVNNVTPTNQRWKERGRSFIDTGRQELHIFLKEARVGSREDRDEQGDKMEYICEGEVFELEKKQSDEDDVCTHHD